METRVEVSAGGVVFRTADTGRIEVALIHTHEGRWQLPKGWVEDGEERESAAAREVREETGLIGKVLGPIDTVDFWFRSVYDPEPARIHKFVHFFLLEYESGSTADHDDEVQDARWFDLNEAVIRLTFDSERGIVKKVREALDRLQVDDA